ncbi:LysR family transcriptional regulator [Aquibacillus koreensis]|uniref:LysR family transcriptional regulator n=1 Tax=Aquibacillus koreensis TaxID=279446 RepID=A0A9X4ALM9_9BACI|nr:LysR family transcriptional regulator [Aquibacillus koreensis]MCT2537880.1 LysR family transcriptional regulator [Aquibacillus koreensis]MDC3422648.1 LysR family transcriptional regulator [Aquibacillus koreensis]
MDQQLLAFVTVVEKNNFTRAAETLHLTQSAITLAVKALEKKYGAQLLDRSNKHVRLTKAGEIVYYHAKEILSNYEKMKRLVEDLSHNASGKLLIGASYTFGEYILPKLLASFNKRYPKIEPDISIHNSTFVINQLINGELDLGIIEGKIEHQQIDIIPFAQDEMLMIVAKDHPLANIEEIEISELTHETWIIREEGSGTRQVLDRLFQDNLFTPKQTRTFGSSQIIKESVEAGLGIALLSQWVFRKEMQLGTIKAIRIKEQPILRKFFYAVRKSDFQPKTTHLFLEFLIESS